MPASTQPQPGFHPPGAPGLLAPSPPCLLVIGDEDASFPEEVSALAAARGWRHLAICRGHAGDERTRREHLRCLTGEYDRLLAQASTLRAAGTPPVWVIAAGYGAYLATLLSERRAIDRMLLRSPAVYPDAGWDLSKLQLDDRRARSRSQIRLAPNDNLALCAAGRYLGQVWIVDSPGEDTVSHSLHVDYFHAFSRARGRSLGAFGTAAVAPGVSSADAAGGFRDTLVRWLAPEH